LFCSLHLGLLIHIFYLDNLLGMCIVYATDDLHQDHLASFGKPLLIKSHSNELGLFVLINFIINIQTFAFYCTWSGVCKSNWIQIISQSCGKLVWFFLNSFFSLCVRSVIEYYAITAFGRNWGPVIPTLARIVSLLLSNDPKGSFTCRCMNRRQSAHHSAFDIVNHNLPWWKQVEIKWLGTTGTQTLILGWTSTTQPQLLVWCQIIILVWSCWSDFSTEYASGGSGHSILTHKANARGRPQGCKCEIGTPSVCSLSASNYTWGSGVNS
jgi:hypothetical protein